MSAQILSARLKADTAELHESMHVLMGRLAPFAGRDRYVRFVAAQYVFGRRVNLQADHPWLHATIADLPSRSRVDAARQDLIDLDDQMSEQCRAWMRYAAAASPDNHALPEHALGWLYVSEGSTLGAAFLFKEAQASLALSAEFGARNLAASPAGRMQDWRAFVAALDAAALSREQADHVIAGAHEAFAFFGQTLNDAFCDAAPSRLVEAHQPV